MVTSKSSSLEVVDVGQGRESQEAGALEVDCDGVRTPSLFDVESEAEILVWLGRTFEGLWRVRTTAGGELFSVARAPCTGVRSVALDPSPAMESQRIALVSIDREKFVGWIGPGSTMPRHVRGGHSSSFSDDE